MECRSCGAPSVCVRVVRVREVLLDVLRFLLSLLPLANDRTAPPVHEAVVRLVDLVRR